MGFSFSRLSLLWKILLSTSVAITLFVRVTGWIVEKNALDTTSHSLEEEGASQLPRVPVAVAVRASAGWRR